MDVNEHEGLSNITLIKLDTNKSKRVACSRKWYRCKWTWGTIYYYTY